MVKFLYRLKQEKRRAINNLAKEMNYVEWSKRRRVVFWRNPETNKFEPCESESERQKIISRAAIEQQKDIDDLYRQIIDLSDRIDSVEKHFARRKKT